MEPLELLEWWCEQFELQISSFSSLSDGVAFAQLLDALYPGSVELHRLKLAPATLEERVHNLRHLEGALHTLGMDVEMDVHRLARGDETALVQLAEALRSHAEQSAERLDAVEGYAALKARMEANAAGAPIWGEPSELAAPAAGRVAPVDSPQASQRSDELGQLVDCLKQELTKRMQALEEQQTDFYEARHERGLLFSALQRVEKVCIQSAEAERPSALAGEILGIVADTPEDWKPASAEQDDDDEYYPVEAAASGMR